MIPDRGYIVCTSEEDYNLINYWIKKEVDKEYTPPKYKEFSKADEVYLAFFTKNNFMWSITKPQGLFIIDTNTIEFLEKIFIQRIIKQRLTDLFNNKDYAFDCKNVGECMKLSHLLNSLGFTWNYNVKVKYDSSNIMKALSKPGSVLSTHLGKIVPYESIKDSNIIYVDNILEKIGFNKEGKKIN